MKEFLAALMFDNKLANELKKANTDYLYNLLCSGKITLQEYLQASKN